MRGSLGSIIIWVEGERRFDKWIGTIIIVSLHPSQRLAAVSNCDLGQPNQASLEMQSNNSASALNALTTGAGPLSLAGP